MITKAIADCYIDNVNIKNIPLNTYCMLWCSEHSTYHFLYGQDISDIHYLKDEKTAERRGTIIFHDDKKVILGNLNNFMVYLNYFTSNGFELISYNPSINSTLFTNSSALLRKK